MGFFKKNKNKDNNNIRKAKCSKDDRPVHFTYAVHGAGDLSQAHEGEWIDLRAAFDTELTANEFTMIDLGVRIQLPEGYEAILAPRSSSFKKYGFIQTNGIGVIDHLYSGPGDCWMLPVLPTKTLTIPAGERIAQFRIQKQQPPLVCQEIDPKEISCESRGGFGSTGR